MTEDHLIQTYEKEYEEFLKYKWNDHLMLKKINSRKADLYNKFMELIHPYFTNIIINDIQSLVCSIQKNIDKELKIHSEEINSKELIIRRLKKVNINFLENPYNHYANPENMLITLCNPIIYQKLSNRLWNHFMNSSSDLVMDDYRINVILYCIKDPIIKLKKIISLSIENVLLKQKLLELNQEPTEKKLSKNQLTRNQTVLLFDRLGFLNLMEDYSNVSKAKLISILSGYGYDNIKKSIEALEKPPKELNRQYKEDSNTIEAFIKGLT